MNEGVQDLKADVLEQQRGVELAVGHLEEEVVDHVDEVREVGVGLDEGLQGVFDPGEACHERGIVG